MDIERLQSEEFLLCGYKVKVFLGGDFKFLDDCLGYQGSAGTYPSEKYSAHRDHLKIIQRARLTHHKIAQK